MVSGGAWSIRWWLSILAAVLALPLLVLLAIFLAGQHWIERELQSRRLQPSVPMMGMLDLTGGVHGDGCDLVQGVLTLQPAASVIVLTGYSSPELAQSAADGKIAALPTKPQSIPFLSQFLVGMPQDSIETSIKG